MKVAIRKEGFDVNGMSTERHLRARARAILTIRGAGPIYYSGGAEVANMSTAAALIRGGVEALSCTGDGRQSSTSSSLSILQTSPDATVGGGLALLRTGDRFYIDLTNARRTRLSATRSGQNPAPRSKLVAGYEFSKPQKPWQEIQRILTSKLSTGSEIDPATKCQRVAQTHGTPRDSD